jgi:hypothetical protein
MIKLIGLEMYGIFWLKAFPRPKEQIAMVFLQDSIAVYGQWGAKAKVLQLHTMCSQIVHGESRKDLLTKVIFVCEIQFAYVLPS